MIAGSRQENRTTFVSAYRVVALVSVLALLASSAAAVVHSHTHFVSDTAHEGLALAPAEGDAPASHAVGPCVLCAAGARDEVASAPAPFCVTSPDAIRASLPTPIDGAPARWHTGSAPARAPPTF